MGVSGFQVADPFLFPVFLPCTQQFGPCAPCADLELNSVPVNRVLSLSDRFLTYNPRLGKMLEPFCLVNAGSLQWQFPEIVSTH
jgi:hypothetical protein